MSVGSFLSAELSRVLEEFGFNDETGDEEILNTSETSTIGSEDVFEGKRYFYGKEKSCLNTGNSFEKEEVK